MEILIGILIVGILIYFFVVNTSKKHDEEVNNIVESIDTFKKYEKLEEKLNIMAQKILDLEQDILHGEGNTANKEEKKSEYSYKIEQIEDAIKIIRNNPWKYYYNAELSPFIDLEELTLIGKVISIEEYKNFEEQLKNKMEVITVDCISSDAESKDIAKENLTHEAKLLIKARTILESDLPQEEKEKKYNNFISKNNILLQYFNKDNINYYQQCTN